MAQVGVVMLAAAQALPCSASSTHAKHARHSMAGEKSIVCMSPVAQHAHQSSTTSVWAIYMCTISRKAHCASGQACLCPQKVLLMAYACTTVYVGAVTAATDCLQSESPAYDCCRVSDRTSPLRCPMSADSCCSTLQKLRTCIRGASL